ncbi:MAG: hypothetical protein QNJ13_15100 [Paracoccaceae bacterium]|nr:hypothetical protein [Paracoccaceae bacterium]
MSTWISRTVQAGLAAAVLAGCAGEVDVTRLAPESVLVAEDVVVAGPPGYCVDPGAVRQSGTAAFVLLGSCASLSGGGLSAMPDAPGVLTVLVSPEGAGAPLSAASEAQLVRFFESEDGRTALSADGRAESVEILELRADDGQIYVRARDLSGARPLGVAEDYWRALFDLNGHLVTATVIGFEARPLDAQDGLRTLSALTARLFRENPPSFRE